MYEQHTCKNTWKKGREEKTKFSKILPNNQIITACHIKLSVKEMTMNKKLTMTGLRYISLGKNIWTGAIDLVDYCVRFISLLAFKG